MATNESSLLNPLLAKVAGSRRGFPRSRGTERAWHPADERQQHAELALRGEGIGIRPGQDAGSHGAVQTGGLGQLDGECPVGRHARR